MNRRRLITLLSVLCPLSAGALLAEGKGRGKGGGDRRDHKGPDRTAGRDGHYFRREDHVVVQRYYTGPRDLPPGLRKKYYRTGTLPPGWQKKMRPFPAELVRVLPPPPPNCVHGFIDGVAVVYDRRTRIIVDTIDLISAIAGH